MRSPGFQWFVAWRYLMARPRRLSRPIMIAIAVFIGVTLAVGLAMSVYPLTDEYLAAGSPVPMWFPLALGSALALPSILLVTHAAQLALLARPRPPGWMLRLSGGLVAFAVLCLLVLSLSARMVLDARIGQFAASGAACALTAAVLLVLLGCARRVSLAVIGLAGVGAATALAMTGIVAWRNVEGARLPVWFEIWGMAGGVPLVPWTLLLRWSMSRIWRRSGPRGMVDWLGYACALPVAVLLAAPVLYFAVYSVRAHDSYSLAGGWQWWEFGPAALLALGGAAAAVGGLALRGVSLRAAMRLAALLALMAVLWLVAVRQYWMFRVIAEALGPSGLDSGSVPPYGPPIWLGMPLSIAVSLIALTSILLGIRYFFTFFTTVSIGGVAIGTTALVIVLSVMSGFETDLRSKILGSNAHVLITRHDEAPFPGYRAVMEKAARVPGVVAQTPYLTSEVVVAGSSNYFNVVIKGIDPATIARVTDLGQDLDDEKALERMWPLTGAGGVAGPPAQAGAAAAAGAGPGTDEARQKRADVLDPAPSDLKVEEAPPVDWSGSSGSSGRAAPRSSSASRSGPGKATDPAPPDLEAGESPPIDWSGGLTEAAPGPAPAPAPAPAREAGPSAEPPGDLQDASGAGRADGLDDSEWLPPPAREIDPHVAALPGVLVGRELVKQINLYEGQEVKVISPLGQNTVVGQTPYIKPYRVAGMFFTGMYEYDLKRIYVELGTLQDFLDLPDEVTGIEIRVSDPEETDGVIRNLRQLLGPGYTVQDWKELNRSLFSALKLEKIAMFLVLAVIILVASFSIVGNLIMVVVEKQREIAVLKTLGASDAGVTRVFIVQGFFIGLVGTAIGMLVGLGACFLADRYGIGIPAEVYYIDRLPIHVEPLAVTLVAAAGLLISVAATIYPAQIAARLRPVQGLRYE